MIAPRLHVLEREQHVPVSIDEAFGFFSEAENLEAITPAWLRFRIVTPRPLTVAEGALIDYRLRLHGLPLRWRTRIVEWQPPTRFVDVQVRGPYRSWRHTHALDETDGGTRIRDRVEYTLPLGPLGELAQRLLVQRDLERIFDHRHEVVRQMLTA